MASSLITINLDKWEGDLDSKQTESRDKVTHVHVHVYTYNVILLRE